MAAPFRFSIGYQTHSARFFYSSLAELQSLPSLVTSEIYVQLTAHPTPAHTTPCTYFLPGLVESYPIDIQLSIWPKTERAPINSLSGALSVYSSLL